MVNDIPPIHPPTYRPPKTFLFQRFLLNRLDMCFMFYTLKTKLFPTACVGVAPSWTVAVPVNHIWCVVWWCVGVGEISSLHLQILQQTTWIGIQVTSITKRYIIHKSHLARTKGVEGVLTRPLKLLPCSLHSAWPQVLLAIFDPPHHLRVWIFIRSSLQVDEMPTKLLLLFPQWNV